MDEKTLYNLLIEQEKHYSVTELGCGMKEYKEVIDGYWRTRYLLNTNTKSAYEIVGRDLLLKPFTPDDLDMESIGKFRHAGNAMRMAAHYPVSIYPFRDGVAYVSWTLYPDGMYFMAEDGFVMDCCDEETGGAYIDTDCNIVVIIQDMEESTKRKRLYEEALLMERKSKEDKI